MYEKEAGDTFHVQSTIFLVRMAAASQLQSALHRETVEKSINNASKSGC
jgi:hypothetical protein